jgi:hypothetical protein
MFSKSWEAVTMVKLRDKLPKRLLDRNKREQDSKKKRKRRWRRRRSKNLYKGRRNKRRKIERDKRPRS